MFRHFKLRPRVVHLAGAGVLAAAAGTASLAIAGWGPLGGHTKAVAAPLSQGLRSISPDQALPPLSPPTAPLIHVRPPNQQQTAPSMEALGGDSNVPQGPGHTDPPEMLTPAPSPAPSSSPDDSESSDDTGDSGGDGGGDGG